MFVTGWSGKNRNQTNKCFEEPCKAAARQLPAVQYPRLGAARSARIHDTESIPHPFHPEDHHGGLHPSRQFQQLPGAHVLEMERRWGAVSTGFRTGDGPPRPGGPRGGRPP
jgi:hypothetical protein